MTEITWSTASDDRGHETLEFRLTREGQRDVTGALWLPAEMVNEPTLMCFGHGASGDRYQAPIPYLAAKCLAAGMPVLSMDGPVHGLRKEGPGGRESFFPEFQREDAVIDMVEDWRLAILAAQERANVGACKLAYFGLSMGSIFGIPLVGHRDDVLVATLGLVGLQDNFPHGDALMDGARNVTCPVLFLMQLEDELFNRDGYLAVFDALASADKRIHANPGLHPEIPAEEVDFAFEFLIGHINGTRERRVVNPLAE